MCARAYPPSYFRRCVCSLHRACTRHPMEPTDVTHGWQIVSNNTSRMLKKSAPAASLEESQRYKVTFGASLSGNCTNRCECTNLQMLKSLSKVTLKRRWSWK